jgi:hypothetical protein
LTVMSDSESMLILLPLIVAPSRSTPVVAVAWMSGLPWASVPCSAPVEVSSDARRMSLAVAVIVAPDARVMVFCDWTSRSPPTVRLPDIDTASVLVTNNPAVVYDALPPELAMETCPCVDVSVPPLKSTLMA